VIRTPIHNAEHSARLGAVHPIGHTGEILYLESTGFVTGETFYVDGGEASGHQLGARARGIAPLKFPLSHRKGTANPTFGVAVKVARLSSRAGEETVTGPKEHRQRQNATTCSSLILPEEWGDKSQTSNCPVHRWVTFVIRTADFQSTSDC
jgi:hypothetical protein